MIVEALPRANSLAQFSIQLPFRVRVEPDNEACQVLVIAWS